jgi:hypothetical protein
MKEGVVSRNNFRTADDSAVPGRSVLAIPA